MKSDIQQFEEVLTKFQFIEPVPHDIRERAGAQVKPALQATLKAVHRYSFFTSMVVGTFFIARKIGLGLSMAQSTAVLVVATAVTVTTVSTGGYYTVKAVQERLNPSIESPLRDDSSQNSINSGNTMISTSSKKNPVILAKEVIVIEPFIGQGFADIDIRDLNSSIKDELIKVHGAGRVKTKARREALILRGQLGTGSGSVHLFLRLINSDGEIIHAEAFSASAFQALRGQASKIAQIISSKVK